MKIIDAHAHVPVVPNYVDNLIQILDKSGIKYNVHLSHIYGSEYWTIYDNNGDGIGFRVSDHSKKQESDLQGRIDFRSHKALYEYLLNNDFDISDKTEMEKEFKSEAVQKGLVKKDGEYYRVLKTNKLFDNFHMRCILNQS